MVAPVPADPPSVVEQLVRRLLAFLFALTAFTAALSIATSPRSANPVELENEKLGAIILRIPVPDLPPHVYSVVVRLQRGITPPVEDSVVIVDVAGDTARMQFSLEPGEWTMTIRGRDFSGGTRYAGIAAVGVQAGQYSTATVRMNADAALSDRPEVVLRWGTRPERWRMSLNNPVLAPDFVGWDQDHYYVCNPTILHYGDYYHLWYASGYNPYYSQIDSMWIAYATSLDGIHWKKYGPIQYTGYIPRWTREGMMPGSVDYENGTYRLWFTGATQENMTNAIGFATSKDGLNWQIRPEAIIIASRDEPAVFAPNVIKEGKELYLYYSVRTIQRGGQQNDIRLLTSADIVHWTKRGVVLKGRPEVSWEKMGVAYPHVMYNVDRFQMYYGSAYFGVLGTSTEIGYAESEDGIRWSQTEKTPILSHEDTEPWTTFMVTHPEMIFDRGRIRMWFTGLSALERRWQIAYAERRAGPLRNER